MYAWVYPGGQPDFWNLGVIQVYFKQTCFSRAKRHPNNVFSFGGLYLRGTKGLYALQDLLNGLVLIEDTCTKFDREIAEAPFPNGQQWKALEDLHRLQLKQHELCYEVLRKLGNQQLLPFSPHRIVKNCIEPLTDCSTLTTSRLSAAISLESVYKDQNL